MVMSVASIDTSNSGSVVRCRAPCARAREVKASQAGVTCLSVEVVAKDARDKRSELNARCHDERVASFAQRQTPQISPGRLDACNSSRPSGVTALHEFACRRAPLLSRRRLVVQWMRVRQTGPPVFVELRLLRSIRRELSNLHLSIRHGVSFLLTRLINRSVPTRPLGHRMPFPT
jgi:hypothetical protein